MVRLNYWNSEKGEFINELNFGVIFTKLQKLKIALMHQIIFSVGVIDPKEYGSRSLRGAKEQYKGNFLIGPKNKEFFENGEFLSGPSHNFSVI